MVRLRTLGAVDLRDAGGGELLEVLAQPKRLALLAYLAAAAPAGFHRRDTLLALFWPELGEARARDALNAALRFLRRALGPAAIVSRGAEEVGVDPAALWCDAVAFREHVEGGRHAEALALYRGDLLEGVHAACGAEFEEWVARERARLRACAVRAARTLAEAHERAEHFTTAVASARRAVELSDTDERVLREVLELLHRLGDRAGALHAYELFARRLVEQYGAEPAAETRALIERIRTRDAARPRLTAAADGAPLAPGASPPGRELERWEILRELGRGGMATVYLARDVKHGRHVALKVVRHDPDAPLGAERVLREVQITAQLAHPHVLPLLDAGAADGVLYLVTPYVAGESLRARLRREGQLPLADALRLAAEVAEALDYAHRQGILHRDVKPENVLLADGHAVVADFGVARALVAGGAVAALPETDPAAVVGTRAYMSPEAVEGRADGPSTDIYSFGCVLHEMVTGQPPGRDGPARARLAQHPEVPAGVRQLIGDCVAARPDRRPRSAGEVLRRLEALRPGGVVAAPAQPRARGRRLVAVSVAASGVALAGVPLAWSAASRLADRGPIAVGAMTQLTNTPGLELDPAISPDGKLVAYAAGTSGRTRIHVRPIAGGRAIEVSGGEMHRHRWPAWSPDGTRLAFLATDGDRPGDVVGRLLVVPALGGAPRVLADSVQFFSSPAWSPDGRHLAYPVRGAIRVRLVDGGTTRVLPGGEDAHSLAWSPDGTRLAFVSHNPSFAFGSTAIGNLGSSAVWTVALDGGPPRRLTAGTHVSASPVWTPDGRAILYVSNADGAFDVYHQRVDGDGRARGEPRRLTTGLDAHGVSLSRDGARLAYSRTSFRSNIVAAPIDARRATPAGALRAVTDENQSIETADVTRDGAWLAFDSNRGGRSHLYKMPADGGEAVQLTRGATDDFAPAWSPDGRWIAFHARGVAKNGRRDVYVIDADGDARTRISTDTLDDSYPRWSADGRRLLFVQAPTGPMVSSLGADGRWTPPTRFLAARFAGRWTADGRLVFHRGGDLFEQPTGGAPRLLAAGRRLGGKLASIAVGPDSSVVYARTIDSLGVHAFHAVPLAGGAPRLLLRLDRSAARPSRVLFSTDGRRLYFTIPEAESDLWAVALHRP